MRASTLALTLLALAGLAFGLVFADAGRLADERGAARGERRQLTGRLGLTDLALFTEARYTRHPSQADLHSALQDHPSAFEHFPSGSLLPPPAVLTESHARLAGKTTTPN